MNKSSEFIVNDERLTWEKAFDAIPDLIAIIDKDHRIVKANKAMAEKLRCSSETVAGCHCFEVMHGTHEPPDFCPHSRLLLSENEEHSEAVESRLGGVYDISTTPLFDNEGRLTGSIHVARDIGAHQKKEQLMAENLALADFSLNHSTSELLTRTIDKVESLTGSQIGFFHFLDEDEMTVSMQAWSTNTLNFLCTTEGIEKHYSVLQAGVWVDCIHERRPVIHNDFASLPHRKGVPEGHATIIRELTIPVIRGEKVVAVMGVGNKLTDYDENDIEIVSQLTNMAWEYIVSKRFEEALNKSEQYARALLNAIPDLIFRMDRDGTYLDVKAPREDLYYQTDSIIGKNNRDLSPPDFADLIEAKIYLTLEHGNMEVFEYELPLPGKGIRHFEARMVSNGPDEITAIARDITDWKQTNEALKKKIGELEWFNRMMVDREVKMIELKKEINILANRLGEDDRYVIHFNQDIK
ncbi:MAG: GAF domain-containing protein [Bacteroidota bacterium]